VLLATSLRPAWPRLLLLLLLLAGALARAGLARAAELAEPAGLETRPVGPLAGGATFRLVYAAEEAEAARQVEALLPRAAEAAQRWAPLTAPVTITIHRDHQALESATRRLGFGWMRAWARYSALDLQAPRTWSAGRASDAQLAELLAHELTHCAMYQAAWSPRASAAEHKIPRWFREGMASVTAGEAEDLRAWPAGAATALGAAEPGDAEEAELQYRVAGEAFRLLLAGHGEAPLRGLLAGLGTGLGFAEAFRVHLGVSLPEFEAGVRQRLESAGSRPAAPSSSPASSVTPSPIPTEASALPSATSGRKAFSKPPPSSRSRV